MTIEQLVTLITNNGLSLALVIIIVIGFWKGTPKVGEFLKGYFNGFLDEFKAQNKEFIRFNKSMEKRLDEITATNSKLANAISNQGNRLDNIEEDVNEIKETIKELK